MEDQDDRQRAVEQPGRIDAMPANNALRDRYYFVALDSDGQAIIKGEVFTSAMFRMSERKQERVMLQNLIAELAVLGWQAIPTGQKWYSHRLYYRGPGNVAAPDASRQREGLSTSTMWKWTIAIALFLFALCVLLVFTSEVQFTAA